MYYLLIDYQIQRATERCDWQETKLIKPTAADLEMRDPFQDEMLVKVTRMMIARIFLY